MFGNKKKKEFNPLTITPPQQDEYEDEISNFPQNYPQQLPNIQPANLPPIQPTIQVPTQVYNYPQQPYQQQYVPQPQVPLPPQKEAEILEGAIGEDGYYWKVKTNYPLKIGVCRIEN